MTSICRISWPSSLERRRQCSRRSVHSCSKQCRSRCSAHGPFARPYIAVGLFFLTALAGQPGAAFPAAEQQSSADAAPAPPEWISASDRPSDNGNAIEIFWTPSRHDRLFTGLVTGYEILRAERIGGPWSVVGRTAAGADHFVDQAATGMPYFYKVAAMAGRAAGVSEVVGPAEARPQWFNGHRWNLLLLGGILVAVLFWHIRAAQRGSVPELRPLPAVEALEGAIARAAQEDKPVLFCPGSEDLLELQTVAGLSILEQVAARTRAQDSELIVPHFHALVMAAADETLRHASAEDRPERYPDPDANFYVSDEQFGYVAGVNGLMARKKPAACLYFGSFFAEGLALAEVGRTVGAEQIAGTAENAQIPFLVASCEHVLIGEELFAATAYLSNDPRLRGCLRGQDFGKLLAIGCVGMGVALAVLAGMTGSGSILRLRDALLSVFATG